MFLLLKPLLLNQSFTNWRLARNVFKELHKLGCPCFCISGMWCAVRLGDWLDWLLSGFDCFLSEPLVAQRRIFIFLNRGILLWTARWKCYIPSTTADWEGRKNDAFVAPMGLISRVWFMAICLSLVFDTFRLIGKLLSLLYTSDTRITASQVFRNNYTFSAGIIKQEKAQWSLASKSNEKHCKSGPHLMGRASFLSFLCDTNTRLCDHNNTHFLILYLLTIAVEGNSSRSLAFALVSHMGNSTMWIHGAYLDSVMPAFSLDKTQREVASEPGDPDKHQRPPERAGIRASLAVDS